ncbi:carbohydrate ABC transporter permease [Paenibacillus cymbidii]|uniref:carbohydrate ABC transporter permease n=1 Tax=Paenibacillus cymbidii TaxID=1639034 RepID=UPI0010808B88|nr:carbohydrate ABC transporter permease [Paenibacillus cymbidii]
MVGRLSQGLIYALLLLFSLSVLFPFAYLIAVSLTNETVLSHMSWGKVTLGTYNLIFANNRFFDSFAISVGRTAVGVALNILFSVLLAYGVSKREMPGRKAIMLVIIFTMVFSGGIIPTYIVVTSLGFSNQFLAMIIPSLINAFYVILLRNFFMELPASVEESGKMDGATDTTILFRIILPMSKPVIATISLFYAVYHWNEWFSVLLYIRQSDLWPLQVLLRNLIMEANNMETMMGIGAGDLVTISPESIKMATLIVATFPVAVLYPFVQKYFIKGIIVGSVKG